MMPPLQTVGRVLIWWAGVGWLAELAVKVAQMILVPVLSCVSGMTIGFEG